MCVVEKLKLKKSEEEGGGYEGFVEYLIIHLLINPNFIY